MRRSWLRGNGKMVVMVLRASILFAVEEVLYVCINSIKDYESSHEA